MPFATAGSAHPLHDEPAGQRSRRAIQILGVGRGPEEVDRYCSVPERLVPVSAYFSSVTSRGNCRAGSRVSDLFLNNLISPPPSQSKIKIRGRSAQSRKILGVIFIGLVMTRPPEPLARLATARRR